MSAGGSGSWDGTRVLRCADGPWAGEERLWRGRDLEVRGRPEGRYVAWPARDPRTLVWSIEPRAWQDGGGT